MHVVTCPHPITSLRRPATGKPLPSVIGSRPPCQCPVHTSAPGRPACQGGGTWRAVHQESGSADCMAGRRPSNDSGRPSRAPAKDGRRPPVGIALERRNAGDGGATGVSPWGIHVELRRRAIRMRWSRPRGVDGAVDRPSSIVQREWQPWRFRPTIDQGRLTMDCCDRIEPLDPSCQSCRSTSPRALSKRWWGARDALQQSDGDPHHHH